MVDWNEDWQWALRSGYVKSCQGKIKHPTLILATRSAYSLEQDKPGENFDVYPCPFCGMWHVGHSGVVKTKIYFGFSLTKVRPYDIIKS